MLFPTIMIAFASFCQPSSDTIIVNKQKFVNALKSGLDGKAYKEQRDILLIQVDTLKARIAIKEMIISTMQGKINDYENIVSSKSSIISQMEEQRKLFEQQAKDLNKQIRKQQRSKTFFKITTFVTIGAGAALYFLK